MRKLTAVTPATTSLPPDLRLLFAPIRATGLVSGRDHEARSEGVIVDEEWRVIAFVVRVSPTLAAGGPRTLVPVTALSPSDTGLDLSWSEDKLLEHPRLDERAPDAETAADHAGGDADRRETFNGAAAGTAIGAGFGAIAAFAFPPIGVLAMAAFFAAGGLLVGAAAGAAQPAPPKEGEDLREHSFAFGALERALRDPAVLASGVVRVTTFEEGFAPAELVARKAPATTGRASLREGMSVTSADRVDLGLISKLGDRDFQVEKGVVLPQDLDIPYADIASISNERVVLMKRRHEYVEAPNGEPMVTRDELRQLASGELTRSNIEATVQKL